MSIQLPAMMLSEWQPARDTLHTYAKIIGKIRANYMPKSKHWWHITLSVSARGLTTTPFPVAGKNVELCLNLLSHQLEISCSNDCCVNLPLVGQSEAGFIKQIFTMFSMLDTKLPADLFDSFDSKNLLPYNALAIKEYCEAINWIDAVFKEFKGKLRAETSPVHIFPHHLDLAMNWFSGRLVPGVDPADEENADEQMNFGFVTGDGSISEAYFYATAYPAPDNWSELTLPDGAYWHTEGWTGAILLYAELVKSNNPKALLLDYLQSVQAHGAKLMA